MKRSHGLAALGIIFALLIGVVLLNAVQAQTNTNVVNAGVNATLLPADYPMLPLLKKIYVTMEREGFLFSYNGTQMAFIEGSGDSSEADVYQQIGTGSTFARVDCEQDFLSLASTALDYESYLHNNSNITFSEMVQRACNFSDKSGSTSIAEFAANIELGNAVLQSLGTSVAETTATSELVAKTIATSIAPGACDAGTVIKINNKESIPLTSGKYNVSQTNLPLAVSADPFSITSTDDRVPASFIFATGTDYKYRLNISSFEWADTDDPLVVKAQLCYNEDGVWKSYWTDVTYAIYNNGFVNERRQNAATAFAKTVSDRAGLPELRATFMGSGRGDVTVYFYATENSLFSVGIDAQKDIENTLYRFDFDASTKKLLQELPEYKGKTLDEIKRDVILNMTVKGKGGMAKNSYAYSAVNGQQAADSPLKLITAEGILQNSNSTDNSYWIIPKMVVSGDYEITLTPKGHRPVKIPITVAGKDLSTSEASRLSKTDIKLISILSTDLKKDRCTNVNDLSSALLCADTAFVDAFISAK